MGEDEKMFQIGLWSCVLVSVLAAILQVCYRTQNRSRNHIRSEIVRTQQDIAVAQANFASYVRPEILRNLVVSVAPKSETISFHKSITVDALDDRKQEQ